MDIDNLRVASPCPVSWEEMVGDNSVRFCKHCELNVYNFSELTRKEAEQLLAKTEGRICGRLYRRPDGTLLTKDCPVGLRALRKRMSRRAAALFATVIGICSTVFGQTPDKSACISQVKVTELKKLSNSEPTTLAGTVLDPTSAIVPLARIVIKNEANLETKTFTTKDGNFSFAGLAEGTYSVVIEASGFKTLTITEVKLRQDQVLHIDAVLQISAEPLSGVVEIVRPSMIALPPGSFTISGEALRMLTH